MNIKIDIDMTPEEVRRLMGLPDVQEFNQKVMADMMQRMSEGMEGYDPVNFFQSSVVTNNEMTKQWLNMLTQFASSTSK
ncbi:MAG: hypothetical protein CR991_08110 [Proteobacteria bacterium]|nr:MAG: hypothetical protein CR991_08110 [Pseudomonadota bacterium]